MKCKCGAIVNVSWAVCLVCKAALEKPKTAPRMSATVAAQLAVDSEAMFIHLWRKLVNRLNRVMAPGYTGWVQTHAPELWARREAAREAWDTPEAFAALKDCRTLWAEYRRRIYAWVRAELACIRRHRDSVSGVGNSDTRYFLPGPPRNLIKFPHSHQGVFQLLRVICQNV